jgi:Xaa-Pro aminopeptidase
MLWEGGSGKLEGLDIAELASWLEKQKPTRLFPLGQPSAIWLNYEGVADAGPLARLQEQLNKARRIKDPAEAQLVRELAGIANAGYTRLQNFIKAGVSERQIQIEYEKEVLKAGSEKFPYDTIVGAGRNAAILHAIPTSRVVQKGDLVLIDAGADIQDYCVDITRVFAANGSFSQQQKVIYELVAKAQQESIQKARPGVEWHDVHRAAARTLADGLKGLNLMRGNTEDLLESGAISVFFPHGVGHMVGQRVRDVGGDATKPLRSCCGVRVRVDLPLEENFMMTVEPGLYFVPAILDDSSYRSRYKEQVNWSEVEKWRDFGGIRIEDDVLIKSPGAEVLTAVVEK